MSDLVIPEEARQRGDAEMRSLRGMGITNVVPDIVRVAAPLIVAAELERMRRILARLWPDPFGEWSADQAHAARVVKQALIERLESRASELRGDKPECTCDYGAVAPGVVEPPTTDPGCPEHGSWHDTRFGPPSRHAGTYEGCLACESRQQKHDPLLRHEATAMDPGGVTAQPMDGRCEP